MTVLAPTRGGAGLARGRTALLATLLIAAGTTPAALDAFLAKVPSKPSAPETMPALLARVQKVAEAFGNDQQRQAMAQRAQANAGRYSGGEAEAWYAQAAIL